VPGDEAFYEHVHLRFDGNYLLARTVLDVATRALADAGIAPAPAAEPPARDECARRLAYTAWNEIQMMQPIARVLAQPPLSYQYDHERRVAKARAELEALARRADGEGIAGIRAAYQAAIAAAPEDWPLHFNFGRMLLNTGDPTAGAEEFRAAYQLLPSSRELRLSLALVLPQVGKAREAISHFEQLLRRRPDDEQAARGLEEARRTARRP
jgi:predicted Zn-dependent protease